MVISLSAAINQVVINQNDSYLGRINHCLFDYNLRCRFVILSGIARKIISFDDFIEYDGDTLKFHDSCLLTEKEFKAISEPFIKLIELTAITQSGARLGKISDGYIDLISGDILRLTVKNYWRDRIIPRQFVWAVEKDKIIFSDDVNRAIFEQLVTREKPQSARI